MLGLRRDHLQARLGNPRDRVGLIQLGQLVGSQDLYTADLRTKLWIPYAGLRICGTNYKADLLFSPFASSEVTLPFRYRNDIFIGFSYDQIKYTFDKPGTFLEASLDYSFYKTGAWEIGCWFKGSLLSIRGRGNQAFQESLPPGNINANFPGVTSAFASSSGILVQRMYGVGITANFTF